jgi:hypothetical protein
MKAVEPGDFMINVDDDDDDNNNNNNNNNFV